MDLVNKSRVTIKGRITMPAQLRRKLGIEPGTKVCFIERGDEIIFQPVTKKYIRSVCGMLKSDGAVTEELVRERKRDEDLAKHENPRI